MQQRQDESSMPISERFKKKQGSLMGTTLSSIKTMNKKFDEKGGKDARIWSPKANENDDVTTYYLKFMPPKDFETSKIDLLLVYKHWFQLPNKNWVVTACPNTIEEECPICEARRELYSDKENPKSQALADSIKKNRVCVVNVLILDDPVEPENNGKIFLWEIGKAITELIETKMNPDKDKSETKYNVFDPFESGILKLKVQYDKTPIAQSGDQKKSIKTKNYSGSVFIDPQNYNDQQKKWIINDERFEKLINNCYSLESYLIELNVPNYKKCKEYFESKLNGGKKTGPGSLATSMLNSSGSEKKNHDEIEKEMSDIAEGMPDEIKKALDQDADLKSKMAETISETRVNDDDDVFKDDIFEH